MRSDRWILRGVTWSVPSGACAAILGPNGSGKSTLTRIVGGHLWPTAGECTVLGGHFGETNLAGLRRSIRLVQSAGPYDVDPSLSARDVLLTGFFGTLALYDAPTDAMQQAADRLLEQVGLVHVADHIYSTLSSGERVRSLVARALAARPGLLLLDEPTAGLDLLAREQVLATVQALFEPAQVAAVPPPTVVFITHHVEELPPATSHVLLLDGGTVAAQGTPQQVLRSDVLSRVYRCPLTVTRRDGRHYVHVDPGAWRGLLPAGRRKSPPAIDSPPPIRHPRGSDPLRQADPSSAD
jgi:iron complex transport system ATP-binding protein